MKIYGNERTSLTLTEKAFNAYSNSDPMKIIENDDGSYDITGVIEVRNITEEQVNRELEALYDDCFSEEDED